MVFCFANFLNMLDRCFGMGQLSWLASVCFVLVETSSHETREVETGTGSVTLLTVVIVAIAALLVLPVCMLGVGTPKKANKGQRHTSCGHIMSSADPHSYCPGCREKGKGPDACGMNLPCKVCDSLSSSQREKLAKRRPYKGRKSKKQARDVEAGELTERDTGDSVHDRSTELGLSGLNIGSHPMDDSLLDTEVDPLTGQITGLTGILGSAEGLSGILLGQVTEGSMTGGPLTGGPLTGGPLTGGPLTGGMTVTASANLHSNTHTFVVPQQPFIPPQLSRMPGITPLQTAPMMTPRTELAAFKDELRQATEKKLSSIQEEMTLAMQAAIENSMKVNLQASLQELKQLAVVAPPTRYPPPTATVSAPLERQEAMEIEGAVGTPPAPRSGRVCMDSEQSRLDRSCVRDPRDSVPSSSSDSEAERERHQKEKGKALRKPHRKVTSPETHRTPTETERELYAKQGARPKVQSSQAEHSTPQQKRSTSPKMKEKMKKLHEKVIEQMAKERLHEEQEKVEREKQEDLERGIQSELAPTASNTQNR